MRRRQFLASGTALLSVTIAGCAHPPVVLDMDEASVDDIADAVSTTAEPGSKEHTVVSAAIENGSSTRSGRSELFGDQSTVRFDDAFYDVSETETGRREVTVYDVRIDFDPADSTPEYGEIAYDDLPEADQRRLEGITSLEDPPTGEGYDLGVGYGTAEEVGDGSVFVPDQEYDILVHEGERYRVAVDSRTASEATYRYEVTEIASDVDAFADRVREEFLFTLSGLSDAEREVVESAIESGYFEDDEAFQSVADRIRAHDGIDVSDSYGTWLLEYEDVEYLTYVEW